MDAHLRLGGALAALALLVPTAAAQPLPLTYDVMVADSGNDLLLRLSDLTQNLSYTEPGEWTVHYHAPQTDGGPALSNPSALAFDSHGFLYTADTTADLVLRTVERGGDGMAAVGGSDEWKTWLDNGNLSFVTFASILAITFDGQDRLYGVNAGSGSTSFDHVFRAADLNGDGDAQDAGEVTIVYDSTSGLVDIAVPSAIAIEPASGDLIVSDVNPDNLYRLHDANGDGDYYEAGEVTLVYTGTQPGQPGLSNGNALVFGPAGELYVNDTLLDAILRLEDLNADGDFEDAGEATVFASQDAQLIPSNQFGMAIDELGRIFAVENTAGDFVVRYEDLNADGDADDAGERVIMHDFASPSGLGSSTLARAIALVPKPKLTALTGPTIGLGQTLQLKMDGLAYDLAQLLFGIQALPHPISVAPNGVIGYVPLGGAPLLFLNATGEQTLSLQVPPSGIPVPLTIHFSAAMGQPPYRFYLTNDVSVTVQ